MDKINWPGVAETGLGAAIGLVPSLVNFGLQNYMIKDNRKYLQDQTNAQWKRDDNAYQRAVEDATKAGLSPLAVSGGASSSSPLTAVAQAPQMDISQAIGLALSSAQLDEQKRQFNERLNFDKDVSEKNFAHLSEQLRQNQDQFSQNLSAQLLMFTDQQNLENKKGEEAYLASLSQYSYDSYKQFCQDNDFYPEVKYYSDLYSYKAALEAFSREFMRLEINNTTSTSSNSLGAGPVSVSLGSNKRDAYTGEVRQTDSANDFWDSVSDDYKSKNPSSEPKKRYKLVYPIFYYNSKFAR